MAYNSMNVIRRRMLVFALMAALLCACLSFAQAETGMDTILVTIDNCTADNDYMLLLVTPGTSVSDIGESTLLFADQITASGGTIRAAIVMPDFSRCDVYAGGDFSDAAASPRKVASYVASRLPAQTVEIEEAAFEHTAFTHIYLSSRVSSIGKRAFAACSELVYVYIPSSVTTIDSAAFAESPHVVIGCETDSAAYDFALQNSLPFVIVNP